MSGRPAALAAPDPALKSRLRRMRLFATALLLVMAVIFVATTWFLSPTPYLGAIRAFATASLTLKAFCCSGRWSASSNECAWS